MTEFAANIEVSLKDVPEVERLIERARATAHKLWALRAEHRRLQRAHVEILHTCKYAQERNLSLERRHNELRKESRLLRDQLVERVQNPVTVGFPVWATFLLAALAFLLGAAFALVSR